jgi:DNA-binding CsgD family transcriptional regulator
MTWTEDEVTTLRGNLELTVREFHEKHMPYRSARAIRRKAQSLNIKFKGDPRVQKTWTDEEILRLRELAQTHTKEEIAQELGRTPLSVKNAVKKHGIKVLYINNAIAGKVKKWTQGDIAELYGYAGRYTMDQAAKKLGRSRSSVMDICQKHKILFRQGILTARKVSEILGVDVRTVQRHRDLLGLQWRKFRKKGLNAEGASESDVQAIAKSILEETASGNLQASLRNLKKISDGHFEIP